MADDNQDNSDSEIKFGRQAGSEGPLSETLIEVEEDPNNPRQRLDNVLDNKTYSTAQRNEKGDDAATEVTKQEQRCMADKLHLCRAKLHLKNKLYTYMELFRRDQDPERMDILKQQIEEYYAEYNEIMDRIADVNIANGHSEELDKSLCEREEMDEKVSAILFSFLSQPSVAVTSTPMPVRTQNRTRGEPESDLFAAVTAAIEAKGNPKGKLKPISIPIFSGKSSYDEFISTFDGLVNESESPTVKMIRLKESLSGAPKALVEKLQCTQAGYSSARKLLKETYGGTDKDIARFLREAREHPKVRGGDIIGFRNFVESLVAAIENTECKSELGNGSLYAILFDKLNQSRQQHFLRWLADEERSKSVSALNRWLNREAKIDREMLEVSESNDSQPKPNQKPNQNSQQPYRQFRQQPVKSNFQPNPYYPSNFANQVKKCVVCEGNHNVPQCHRYNSFPVDDRWTCAKDLKLCFRCLSPTHAGKDCKKSEQCKIDRCTATHHQLLHDPRIHQRKSCPAADAAPGAYFQNRTDRQSLSLRTIPVYLIHRGIRIKVNACLDDGSTHCFVSADAMRKLNIQTTSETNLQVGTLNGKPSHMKSGTVTMHLASLDRTLFRPITAYTCPNTVMGDYEAVDWTRKKHQYGHLSACNFYPPAKPNRVDLLIGTNEPDLHQSRIDYTGPPGSPAARLTPLGWTCIGPSSNVSAQSIYTHCIRIEPTNEEVLKAFQQMWEEEPLKRNIDDRVVLKPDEKRALSIMSDSLTHDGERYEIGIPWSRDPHQLPNNFSTAVKRLYSLKRSFQKKPGLEQTYEKVFKEYVELGFIEQVKIEKEGPAWYLPHFAVQKDDRDTTKTRVVFDGASKYKDVSLNDFILNCPKLQTDIFDILLRFRKNTIAVACDLQKMYLNIRIPEKDRKFFRFLWFDENERIISFEFSRVCFGEKAAPCQAIFVSRQNAEMYADQYPRAAESVLKSTYMDDVLDSVDTVKDAKELYFQLTDLWGKAGMKAHKWMSNSSEVLGEIPDTERLLNLSTDEVPTKKVLGQKWDLKSDRILAFSDVSEIDENVSLTTRKCLHYVAGLYDPLGLISPIIAMGRMMIQEMYRIKLEIDDELPLDFSKKFQEWINSLPKVSNLQFERCLIPSDTNSHHVAIFCDASAKATCAVAYMVTYSAEHTYVRFIASKTLICPLATHRSIPQLEITAAEIGVNLAQKICNALKINLPEVKYFTDSTDVLYWIRGQGKDFKLFVKNKIHSIQLVSEADQWAHVIGRENPADLGSRGASTGHLADNALWMNGPEWLHRPVTEWPAHDKIPGLNHELPEQRKKTDSKTPKVDSFVQEVQAQSDEAHPLDVLINKYSRYKKIVRVTGLVLRFVNNCKPNSQKNQAALLSPTEYSNAEKYLIRRVQATSYNEEIKKAQKQEPVTCTSTLRRLAPFIDGGGILRVGGRMHYGKHIPYDAKHPIIIPPDAKYTKSLIEEFHLSNGHRCGAKQILALVNRKYYIPKGLKVIQNINSKCITCQRYEKKPSQPNMAPLTESRTSGSVPFESCGADLAGPIMCSAGPRRSPHKRWIIVFTCHTFRVTRLDIVVNQSEEAFMKAFTRFRSRNGTPKTMITDNGTNFVAASKTLRTEIPEMEWKFNPPYGPHFGGIHESVVKLMKRALVKTIGANKLLTDEELLTALAQCEEALNNRPLTYMSSDPNDLQPLTPNHFVVGRTEIQTDDPKLHLGDRYRMIQDITKQTWDRFIKEFLPELNKIPKWSKSRRPISDGDVVIVMNPQTPRGNWPLGVVMEIYPGKDGTNRVALVRFANGTLMKRPAVKLIPLDIN